MKDRSVIRISRTSWVWHSVAASFIGLTLAWAWPAWSETADDPTSEVVPGEESALDSLAWAGWVGWTLLIAIVSLQFRRQRQLARDIEGLERLMQTKQEDSRSGTKKEP